MRVKDKVAVITGAARGMGAAEARLFAKEGAKIVLSDVNAEDGEAVAKSIRDSGGDARFVAGDVSKEDDWKKLIGAAVSAHGRLDILVNNAGVSAAQFKDWGDVDSWHKLMDINALSVFLGMKHAVPEMVKNGGGSIVNTSSIAGMAGGPMGHPGYFASKGSVHMLTKMGAVRHGAVGVRVNAIYPGFMEPMIKGTVMKPDDPRLLAIPLKRIGLATEVAPAVLFLASDEASYINGAELLIDGGFLAQ